MAGAQESLSLVGTMRGHNGEVTAIATPIDNSPFIVSSSRDRSVLVWDLTNPAHSTPDSDAIADYGLPFRRITVHSHFVQDVVLSSDGRLALSGSSDGELRLCYLSTGITARVFVGHSKDVTSVAFSVDNRQIVSASRDKTIKLWNTLGENALCECEHTFGGDEGHTGWVSCVRFSPDTSQPTIVSGSWDRTVKVWDLTNRKLRGTLVGHVGYVNAVAVSPDGSLCASGDKDGHTLLWDLTEMKGLYSLEAGSIIHSLCFSPNSPWLCAATQDSVKIWDHVSKHVVQDLKPFILISKNQIPCCTSLSWSADGSTLYTGYTDGCIRIWTTSHILQEPQSSKDIVEDSAVKKGAFGPFSDLQTELLFLIFSRLKPDLLTRCGSVCKHWCRAATDTTFLQQRYEVQKQCPLILFMGKTVGSPSTKISTLDLQTLVNRCIGFDLQNLCGEDGHQLVKCFRLHGSCKGVLLYSYHNDLYLCNPVTKRWSQFPYAHINSVKLFLYHHKGTDSFRILKKVDLEFRETSSYYVMELGPGMSGWNERHVADGSLGVVVDPVPKQLGDSLYWVHRENGATVISCFDTKSEALTSFPAPPLAQNRVMLLTLLLDINDQLSASVAWAERNPANDPRGPTHIELWNYKSGNWEYILQVAIPVRADMQILNHLGVGEWSAFICSESGQFLLNVENKIISLYDRDGEDLMSIEAPLSEDNLMLSGFFLKESLLPSQTLTCRVDRGNRLPPFFSRR